MLRRFQEQNKLILHSLQNLSCLRSDVDYSQFIGSGVGAGPVGTAMAGQNFSDSIQMTPSIVSGTMKPTV